MDYYPGGMQMPGRSANPGDYRYGFQGQEKDDEWKGSANSINYKYRVHDPRIGRFLSLDPLFKSFPHNSPYAFSENRVMDAVELEGLESYLYGLLKQDLEGKAKLVKKEADELINDVEKGVEKGTKAARDGAYAVAEAVDKVLVHLWGMGNGSHPTDPNATEKTKTSDPIDPNSPLEYEDPAIEDAEVTEPGELDEHDYRMSSDGKTRRKSVRGGGYESDSTFTINIETGDTSIETATRSRTESGVKYEKVK